MATNATSGSMNPPDDHLEELDSTEIRSGDVNESAEAVMAWYLSEAETKLTDLCYVRPIVGSAATIGSSLFLYTSSQGLSVVAQKAMRIVSRKVADKLWRRAAIKILLVFSGAGTAIGLSLLIWDLFDIASEFIKLSDTQTYLRKDNKLPYRDSDFDEVIGAMTRSLSASDAHTKVVEDTEGMGFYKPTHDKQVVLHAVYAFLYFTSQEKGYDKRVRQLNYYMMYYAVTGVLPRRYKAFVDTALDFYEYRIVQGRCPDYLADTADGQSRLSALFDALTCRLQFCAGVCVEKILFTASIAIPLVRKWRNRAKITSCFAKLISSPRFMPTLRVVSTTARGLYHTLPEGLARDVMESVHVTARDAVASAAGGTADALSAAFGSLGYKIQVDTDKLAEALDKLDPQDFDLLAAKMTKDHEALGQTTDKVLVLDPNDLVAIQDSISKGYIKYVDFEDK